MKHRGGAQSAAKVERNGTLPVINRAAVMRKSAVLLTHLWKHHRRMMAGDFEFDPDLLRALTGYAAFYCTARTERPILATSSEGLKGAAPEDALNHLQGVVISLGE